MVLFAGETVYRSLLLLTEIRTQIHHKYTKVVVCRHKSQDFVHFSLELRIQFGVLFLIILRSRTFQFSLRFDGTIRGGGDVNGEEFSENVPETRF